MKITVGKNLKCKIKTEVRALLTEISKDKLRASEGIAEEPGHRVSSLLKKRAAKINFQNKNGEHNLQPKPPGHRLQANGAPVRGEAVGQASMVSRPRMPVNVPSLSL